MEGSACPIIGGQVPSGDLGLGWLSQEGTRGRRRSWCADCVLVTKATVLEDPEGNRDGLQCCLHWTPLLSLS